MNDPFWRESPLYDGLLNMQGIVLSRMPLIRRVIENLKYVCQTNFFCQKLTFFPFCFCQVQIQLKGYKLSSKAVSEIGPKILRKENEDFRAWRTKQFWTNSCEQNSCLNKDEKCCCSILLSMKIAQDKNMRIFDSKVWKCFEWRQFIALLLQIRLKDHFVLFILKGAKHSHILLLYTV